VEGRLSLILGDLMQHIALLVFDKDRCKSFFERLPELFQEFHHSKEQNPEGYEELLYRVHRPYDNQMLDMIDSWLGMEKRVWREEII